MDMYEPSLRSPIPPNPGPVIYYNYMTYTDLDTVRLIFGDISALGIDVRRDIIKCIRKLPAKHAPNNPSSRHPHLLHINKRRVNIK